MLLHLWVVGQSWPATLGGSARPRQYAYFSSCGLSFFTNRLQTLPE